MPRSSCFRSALLLSLTVLWACPPNKVAAPLVDAGTKAASGPETPAPEVSECPKVRGQAIALPKNAPAELRLVGSAPGRKARPVAILIATSDELAPGGGFPAALVDELVQRQLNVVEAIGVREGEGGKADVMFARSMALRGSCEADPSRVAIIASPKSGASALEIATSTQADHRPAALVLLSGGDHTEARVKIDAHRAELETIPTLFAYADRDAAWSTRFQAEPTSPLWLFRRQSGEAQGFGLFVAGKETADDVAVFLEGFLQ